MSKLLIAAGNYDTIQQVKQALGGGSYELTFAYSHLDTLFILRNLEVDAILIDAALTDLNSGEKTALVIARLPKAPMMLVYGAPIPLQTALNRPGVGFIDLINRHTVMGALNHLVRLTLRRDGPDFAAEKAAEPLGDIEETQQFVWRDDDIQTLFSLSRSLTEVLDLTEVLNRVVQAARHMTEADECILLMPDGETGQFYLRAEVGIDSDMVQTFRVKLQDSFAGEVFTTGEPILIGAGEPLKVKTQYFVNSLLYVPISLKGERIGVLGVSNREKKAMFNRRHLELLTHLASYAAVAIENARVHGLSLQRAQDLNALVKASQVINSSLSLETTLINICQQMTALLSGGRVDIYSWKPSRRSVSGHEPPGELTTMARYFRAAWKMNDAPEIDPKERPSVNAALRGRIIFTTTERSAAGRETSTGEVDHLKQVGAAALLAVPLMVEQQALGVVIAYYRNAPHTSPAPEVIQQVQAAGIEILSGQVNPTEGIAPRTFQQAAEINQRLGSSWVEFTLVASERRGLVMLMTVGEAVWLDHSYTDSALKPFDVPLGMLRQQHAIYAAANGDTSTLGSLAMLEGVNGRALLGVPMVVKGETIGFMLIVDTERSRSFSEREINLARGLAAQASAALKNAELMYQLEASYAQLQMAQERLVHAARLSAMGELAGAVAHQVNNPLTTIVLDAELLLLNQTLDSKARQSLDAILRSGKRAASVVRRLLTTVQPTRSEAAEALGLLESLENTLSLIRAHVQREGIQVKFDCAGQKELYIYGFREDLNDLWLNLLLNAHDALNGRQDAQMGVDVHFMADADAVQVIVWDNGIGIPPENMSLIFEPFFTTKPPGEGTGLGLHICRQIIERLGGSIHVESRPNAGTRFDIRLPVMKEQS
ncbi:MAG: GAF domain-containing protein [bacterium]|nr:GAF domain-containing protein [bacterium]